MSLRTGSPAINLGDEKRDVYYRCDQIGCDRVFASEEACDHHYIHDHHHSDLCEECKRKQ